MSCGPQGILYYEVFLFCLEPFQYTQIKRGGGNIQPVHSYVHTFVRSSVRSFAGSFGWSFELVVWLLFFLTGAMLLDVMGWCCFCILFFPTFHSLHAHLLNPFGPPAARYVLNVCVRLMLFRFHKAPTSLYRCCCCFHLFSFPCSDCMYVCVPIMTIRQRWERTEKNGTPELLLPGKALNIGHSLNVPFLFAE